MECYMGLEKELKGKLEGKLRGTEKAAAKGNSRTLHQLLTAHGGSADALFNRNGNVIRSVGGCTNSQHHRMSEEDV